MNRLPFPKKIKTGPAIWVDEAIWGHRLYDEQTPWMIFLEFLGILQTEVEDERAFREETLNGLKYRPSRRRHLRNILFNNPHLEAVLEQFPNDNEAQWENWLVKMGNATGGPEERDYTYLRQRFTSFKGFASLIQFLQESAIEGDSNKRWTSKFVFPYGPHCLYEDLNRKGSTNDRRFFGRTGELLYLMLCRSGLGEELMKQLQELNLVAEKGKALNQNAKWDRIVIALQPDSDMNEQRQSGSPPYLPYESLTNYRRLAEDWITLFQCQMPGYDVLPHLVNITALHLIRYLLGQAQKELGQSDPIRFVIEIVSPTRSGVRELSADSYLENNQLPKRAIKAYITQIERLPRWQEILKAQDSADPVQEAINLFFERFLWPDIQDDRDKEEMEGIGRPEQVLKKLLEKAETRHDGHLAKCHRAWSREIGFSSSRGSHRIRYAPTDALLKTLIFSTVDKREEFQVFLQKLYDKYGFIIGHVQAKPFTTNGKVDKKDFTDNAVRLEERLASMGLLKRLSDACAYVINPFHGGGNQ